MPANSKLVFVSVLVITFFAAIFGGYLIRLRSGSETALSVSSPPGTLVPSNRSVCGINALQFILRWHGIDASLEECLVATESTRYGTGLNQIVALFRSYGLVAEVRVFESVSELPCDGNPVLFFENKRSERSVHSVVLVIGELSDGSAQYVVVEPPDVVAEVNFDEVQRRSAGIGVHVARK